MNSRLKDFITTLGALAIFAGIFLLGAIFFGFLPRISDFIYRFLNPASGFVFILDLLILPFALSRRLRPLVGTALLFSSYLFGAVLWAFSALVTYSLWGFFGLFIGLIWLGVGVVPIAVIAGALHREWFLVFVILGELVMVFGCRVLGFVFMQAQAVTVDEPKPKRRMVLGGLVGVVMFGALAWWMWHLYGTVPVQAADLTCADFTGYQDVLKNELAYGYVEGVQAELEKDEVDVLVPPTDRRHPMWWVLPEEVAGQNGLPQKLDQYCKREDHRSQKLLDAFLSIAYQNTGEPQFGISFDNKKTDPWKKILGGEESSISCAAYSASPEQERQAVIDGYYLGTQALVIKLKEKRDASHWFVWPPKSSPEDVRIEVDKSCEKDKEGKLRDALYVSTTEMAVKQK
jgi:hypothetical protein